MSAEEACRELGVDSSVGLDSEEVERRRARYGANKLAEARKEPGWRAFLRQYQDLMQLILVAAAIVSVAALEEWHTAIVVFAVTLLNAILGLNQEGKAAESVAARAL
jgi:Ca2+-transporting ATPase